MLALQSSPKRLRKVLSQPRPVAEALVQQMCSVHQQPRKSWPGCLHVQILLPSVLLGGQMIKGLLSLGLLLVLG